VVLWMQVQMFLITLRCKVITRLCDTHSDTLTYEALCVLIDPSMGIGCGRDFSEMRMKDFVCLATEEVFEMLRCACVCFLPLGEHDVRPGGERHAGREG